MSESLRAGRKPLKAFPFLMLSLLAGSLLGSPRNLSAQSAAQEVNPPLNTIVYLINRSDNFLAKPIEVAGLLTKYDLQTLTIKNRRGEVQELNWYDLTGPSAFTLRARLIDQGQAQEWLELGRFGWDLGAQQQALQAFNRATTLNPTLKAKVQEILRTTPGERTGRIGPAPAKIPAEAAASSTASPAASSTGTSSGSPAPAPAAAAPMDVDAAANEGQPFGKNRMSRCKAVTPEQIQAVLKQARTVADTVSQQLHFSLKETPSDHFVIFSDADASDVDQAKRLAETAYSSLGQFFDLKTNESILVGKPPIFMFAHIEDSHSFRNLAPRGTKHPSRTTFGYLFELEASPAAFGLALERPPVDRVGEARKGKAGGSFEMRRQRWNHGITQFVTQMFLARYLTDTALPGWVDQGLADALASSFYPSALDTLSEARALAEEYDSMQRFFTEGNVESKWPHFNQSLVETLLNRDRGAFTRLIVALKKETPLPEALQSCYQLDYPGLEQAWRAYLRNAPGKK